MSFLNFVRFGENEGGGVYIITSLVYFLQYRLNIKFVRLLLDFPFDAVSYYNHIFWLLTDCNTILIMAVLNFIKFLNIDPLLTFILPFTID